MRIYLISVFIVCLATLTTLTTRGQLKRSAPSEKEELIAGINRTFFSNADSTVHFANQLITLAEKSGNDTLLLYAKQMVGEGYRYQGNYPASLKSQYDALNLSRELKDRRKEASTFSFLGFTFLEFGFYEQALQYLIPAVNILDSSSNWIGASFSASNAASCLTQRRATDSADLYNTRSLSLWGKAKTKDRSWYGLRTLIYDRIAANYEAKLDLDNAKLYYHLSLHYSIKDSILPGITRSKKNLARIFMIQHINDSAQYYAYASLDRSRTHVNIPYIYEASIVLDSIFRRKGNADSALYYQTLAMEVKDSMLGPKKFQQLQKFMADEQQRHQKEAIENANIRSRQRLLLMALAVAALLSVVLILRRGNKTKQILNAKLQDKNLTLENTLDRLKATQSQLIQAEKMASLGELTAGIAHEIQNPLNFVNNFSELNKELIIELQDENTEEENKNIVGTISDNLDKVIVHGKRADAIVKAMLQHSRISSGAKELRDLNLLCEEYLGLAYSSMRARDHQFNATLVKDLDPSVGSVEIYGQDISRVLSNLLNNAFYAVHEKSLQARDGYVPEVGISTKRLSPSTVTITIKDNGNGIPEAFLQKIFQPFFTTKPTGEGTGLGLSLSYDVIVKGHGGDITVNSTEGQGAEFVITLPG